MAEKAIIDEFNGGDLSFSYQPTYAQRVDECVQAVQEMDRRGVYAASLFCLYPSSGWYLYAYAKSDLQQIFTAVDAAPAASSKKPKPTPATAKASVHRLEGSFLELQQRLGVAWDVFNDAAIDSNGDWSQDVHDPVQGDDGWYLIREYHDEIGRPYLYHQVQQYNGKNVRP